jgi:hypothetical protein
MDFQAKTAKKTKSYTESKLQEPFGDRRFISELDYLRPGEEMSIVYVYSRFTELSQENKVVIRIKGAEKELAPESMESIGFFLRGSASMAKIDSSTMPLFFDHISQGNLYVCPNDNMILNTLIAKMTEDHKEELDNGLMDINDIIDMCPIKVNPIFNKDFVLSMSNFKVSSDELLHESFDKRGELIKTALSADMDYSKEYIRALCLDAPMSRELLPLVMVNPLVKKSFPKEKILNLSKIEAKELLELFEDTAQNNVATGGLGGPLSLKDILHILLPIVPPKYALLLWNMNFDPMYLTATDEQLWALIFTRLIETDENGFKNYKLLLNLSQETLNLTPQRIKKKLLEKLHRSYEKDDSLDSQVPKVSYLS